MSYCWVQLFWNYASQRCGACSGGAQLVCSPGGLIALVVTLLKVFVAFWQRWGAVRKGHSWPPPGATHLGAGSWRLGSSAFASA